jgi:hypothetical protein
MDTTIENALQVVKQEFAGNLWRIK